MEGGKEDEKIPTCLKWQCNPLHSVPSPPRQPVSLFGSYISVARSNVGVSDDPKMYNSCDSASVHVVFSLEGEIVEIMK